MLSSSSSKWASRACTALSLAALVVLMSSVASADDATPAPAVPECTASQYLNADNVCVDFPRPGAKASQDLSATLNSGNTAWMLTSSALVMIMTPGVAFFYAGLAGEEMASNTIMMSFVSIAMVSIQFFVFGYSVCFGSDGLFKWAGYNDVTGIPSGTYGGQIPHILFALFQTQFAMITPALLSGGIVGRMKFGSFVLFTLLWTSLVYDPLARWMWALQLDSDYALGALGWEGKMGSLDFAGGTVIHVSSGFGALVAAIVVGKRYNHGEEVKPHNVPLVMIGATLLWFGWFGFNAGSSGAADSIAAIAAINTHLAASAGFLTWIAMDWLLNGSVDPAGAASGAVAGLVAITPGCGYVMPWASVIFGVVGAIVAFACVRMKNYLRYDDTLDSFAIHGCAGFVGGLLTGLFATKDVNPGVVGGAFYGNPEQLWHQFVSQCVAAAYSSVVTFIILMALKYTIGIRVSEEKEVNGVDISYHGGAAYTNQSAHGPSSPVLKAANPPQTDFSALMTPSTVDTSEPKANAVLTNV